MTSFVQSTGPLSVCVDANPNSSNGYWKVKNSFGTNWGEAGFIRPSTRFLPFKWIASSILPDGPSDTHIVLPREGSRYQIGYCAW
jgi:hypothetical protein